MITPQFKSHIETEILKTSVKKMKTLNRGGSSKNYHLILDNCSYLLKVFSLHNNNILRSERLLLIGRFLSDLKIQTPHFIKNQFFVFENNIFLLMDFIEGKRVLPADISLKTLSSFEKSEKLLQKADPQKEPFLHSLLTPKDLHSNISEKIEKLSLQKYSFFRFTKSEILHYLEKIYSETPKLSSHPVIIHGDTKPDNFILTQNTLTMLDFEMIRFGYTVEDLAQFLLSLVLQHSVWFWNKKLFNFGFSYFTKAFHLQKEDWVYGTNMYFLRLMERRLNSRSLFLSPRKTWLFLNHLKKQQQIMSFIEKFYFESSGK